MTQTTADDVALNRAVVTETDFSFSTRLDDWKVTNQKRSGRCWMFASPSSFLVGTELAYRISLRATDPGEATQSCLTSISLQAAGGAGAHGQSRDEERGGPASTDAEHEPTEREKSIPKNA